MERTQKSTIILVIAVILVLLIFIFAMPDIDNRTWELSYAQQAVAPYFVVAHGKDFDVSGKKDPMYSASKPIELILEAKNGKLILTDKTNGKTYEGTYESNSGRFGKRSYNIVIDGVEGSANMSTYKTLFMSVGGYCLTFEIE